MRTYIANKKYLVRSDSDLKTIKLLVVPKGRQVILIKLNDKKGERFFSVIKQHRPLKKSLEMWPKFAKGIGMKSNDLQVMTQESGNYVIDESKNVYLYQINSKKQVEINPLSDFCHTLSMLDGKGNFKDIVVEELGYLQNTKEFVKTEDVSDDNKKLIKIEQKISRKNANVVKIFKDGCAPIVEFPEDIELKYDYQNGDVDHYSDNYKKMLN